MNELLKFRKVVTGSLSFLLVAVMLTGCSKTDIDGLPDGKQPMTFTASVDGLTTTRATAGNTWTGGEEVAIRIGSEVKKYTAATNGKLTVESGGTTFYWTNTTMKVEAWHSETYNSTKPASFSVIANQSTAEGYQQSDMLFASHDITFNKSTPASLQFKHLPVKVVVNLKEGDGVTADQVKNATVTLVNQNLTSGTIAADWTVTAATTGSGTITPNTLTPAGGFQKTVQALVVPQQMQNRKFIKVTIGTDAAACDYYYIPTAESDANLVAGKQYNYTITVKKTGLAVTVNNGVAWDESPTSDDVTAATFRVMIPTVGGTNSFTVTGATMKGSYYEVDNNATTFSLTYTFSDYKNVKGFPVVQGLCDMKRESTSNKCTFTYSNIRSDLKLAYDLYGELGDFYCKASDGNGYIIPSDATLTDEQKAACLGIVLKGGRDNSGIWKDDCEYKLKDTDTPMPTINGYVLALHDANGGNNCTWGSYGTQVGTNMEQNTGFYGYNNTNAIKAFDATHGKNLQANFPATYHATVSYEKTYPAPTNSSGWFLPSAGQGKYWLNNRDVILTSIKKATSNSSYNWKSYYWSGSEKGSSPAYSAWYVNFDNGYVRDYNKNLGYDVRGVFAF